MKNIFAAILTGFVILPAQEPQAAPLVTSNSPAAFYISIVKSNAPYRVTLAWNQTTNPIVAGFNIYYGGDSGVYTNKITVGTNTTLSLTNLPSWSTFYFAATTYSAAGAESALSSELSWTAPPGVLFLKWIATNKNFTVMASGSPLGPWTNFVTTTNIWAMVQPGQSRQFFRVKAN